MSRNLQEDTADDEGDTVDTRPLLSVDNDGVPAECLAEAVSLLQCRLLGILDRRMLSRVLDLRADVGTGRVELLTDIVGNRVDLGTDGIGDGSRALTKTSDGGLSRASTGAAGLKSARVGVGLGGAGDTGREVDA